MSRPTCGRASSARHLHGAFEVRLGLDVGTAEEPLHAALQALHRGQIGARHGVEALDAQGVRGHGALVPRVVIADTRMSAVHRRLGRASQAAGPAAIEVRPRVDVGRLDLDAIEVLAEQLPAAAVRQEAGGVQVVVAPGPCGRGSRRGHIRVARRTGARRAARSRKPLRPQPYRSQAWAGRVGTTHSPTTSRPATARPRIHNCFPIAGSLRPGPAGRRPTRPAYSRALRSGAPRLDATAVPTRQ